VVQATTGDSLIKVHIGDQNQKVIEVREAQRGTAAIEFLKCLSGIKECFFAKVKY
jgi:hypothetical protein